MQISITILSQTGSHGGFVGAPDIAFGHRAGGVRLPA